MTLAYRLKLKIPLWTLLLVASVPLPVTAFYSAKRLATTPSHVSTTSSTQRPLSSHPRRVTILTRRDASSQFNTEGMTQEQQVQLRTGVSMQVLSSLPKKETTKPTLLFLHGSFHGAWCWAENFFPYFTERGYPVVALSWRGTGGTFAGEGVKKVKITEHVEDLESLLDQLESIVGFPTAKRPVLVAHSFGSLAVMKDLEFHPQRGRQLAGVAIMCGVPPSGNGKLTLRTLKRSFMDSWKITAGFAMKRCKKKADLCRDLFFGGPVVEREDGTVDDHGISDEDVLRYQSYFARDSAATIDLLDLAKILPSAVAVDGVAPFVQDLSPAFVLGATRDFIVDEEGNEETAIYFGLEEPIMVDSPHDVMLGSNWRNAADALANWLEGIE
mmetsp:Transcript_8065/g.16202  ORF Transcript_8065/g.16202 Transcript_8065/m.16202 type:complete len:385 (-) Transcript_8065:213-1367(-)